MSHEGAPAGYYKHQQLIPPKRVMFVRSSEEEVVGWWRGGGGEGQEQRLNAPVLVGSEWKWRELLESALVQQ
jgi:hypothetical protein